MEVRGSSRDAQGLRNETHGFPFVPFESPWECHALIAWGKGIKRINGWPLHVDSTLLVEGPDIMSPAAQTVEGGLTFIFRYSLIPAVDQSKALGGKCWIAE